MNNIRRKPLDSVWVVSERMAGRYYESIINVCSSDEMARRAMIHYALVSIKNLQEEREQFSYPLEDPDDFNYICTINKKINGYKRAIEYFGTHTILPQTTYGNLIIKEMYLDDFDDFDDEDLYTEEEE